MNNIIPQDIDPQLIIDISRQAGEAIMEIYARDFSIAYKDDQSPLTEADQRANQIIVEALQKHYPEVPLISEEHKLIPYPERQHWEGFFLIDPLDGTKEFIKKNGEFTVNIAFIYQNTPHLGVVHRPTTQDSYLGILGRGSWKINAQGEQKPLTGGPHYSEKTELTVVGSRSHSTPEVDAFVQTLRDQGKQVEFLSAGSSLKLCLVAEGLADLYPRFGPTMEWDTGAAHAVALGAGKQVLQVDTKEPLLYNKESLLNPFFVVE